MKKILNVLSIRVFSLIALLVLIIFSTTACSKKAEKTEKAERNANGQYPIGSKVKVYDGDFKPTDAYFTYSPEDKKIILNFPPPYINAAIFFGKNNFGYIRNCIDKSIEWADTAKKNKVDSFKKEMSYKTFDGDENDGIAMYGLNKSGDKKLEPVYLYFAFYIGDLNVKGKVETWLLMQYLTRNEVLARSNGHLFIFHEKDFDLLKKIFSESYLTEIDKKEEAWKESLTKQDSQFK